MRFEFYVDNFESRGQALTVNREITVEQVCMDRFFKKKEKVKFRFVRFSIF